MLDHIFEILWSLPAVLIAITVHEFSHGYTAYYYGDNTAKLAGRLTLNPIAHLDPIGTLMLIFFRIGWAKPVPINDRNLANPKKDMIIISLAGPFSNIITAFVFAMLIKLSDLLLKSVIISNIDLLPNILLTFIRGWFIFLQSGIIVNLGLAIFNLIPIPPLDGNHILAGLLPARWAHKYLEFGHTYGILLLIVLAWTGLVSKMIFPIIYYIFRLLI